MTFTPNIEAIEKAKENAGAFYCVLRNIEQFDTQEKRGTIGNLISPSERDHCFLAIYWRCVSNVGSILSLTDVKHFQATTMLSRNLFELSVDMKLLEQEFNSVERMIHFSKLESLRAAKKAVDFVSSQKPTYPLDVSAYKALIATQETNINARSRVLWPRASKIREIKHWSEMSLDQRVKKLQAPFEELYACYYKQLSWQVHSGLAGILNQSPESFAHLCALALKIAADSYEIILASCIKEFRLSLANERILDKIEMAKMLAATTGERQSNAVIRHFGFEPTWSEVKKANPEI